MQQFDLAISFDLPPQVADVDVDDVAVTVAAEIVEMGADVLARHGLARTHGEEGEQGVFARGQRHLAPGPLHRPAHRVDLKVGDAQDRILALVGPAQQGADAREQLRDGEGLDQVVVSPGIETGAAVGDLVSGGDDQDMGLAATRAHPPQHLQAIKLGQAEIEQHDIVAGGIRQPVALGAIAAGIDGEAGTGQRSGDGDA